jgi:hypothetical protein
MKKTREEETADNRSTSRTATIKNPGKNEQQKENIYTKSGTNKKTNNNNNNNSNEMSGDKAGYLCSIPIDILSTILLEYIDIMGIHIFRFVCKHLHSVVHNVFFSKPTHLIKLNHNSAVNSWSTPYFLKPRCLRICDFNEEYIFCDGDFYWGYFDILAAKINNLNLFSWAVSTFDMDDSVLSIVCSVIAWNGNLKLLKYARSLGYHWDELTCYLAAEKGNLKMLKWAMRKGCSYTNDTCEYAGFGGHLDIIKWLGKGNYLSGRGGYLAFSSAAYGGQLEVIEWFEKDIKKNIEKNIENNRSYSNVDVYSIAAANGHLNVLQRVQGNESLKRFFNAGVCESAAA